MARLDEPTAFGGEAATDERPLASSPRPAPERPAFYALAPGGWRDLVTLLHPPYTAWHLSYVALGAAVAPTFHLWRLGAALAGFLLGVGVCAHALDELNGRPLATGLSDRMLWALAWGGLLGAIAIGVVGALTVSLTLIPFIVAGGFIVLAYNLELFGGAFHNDGWFAVAWGAFPALTGYWIEALSLRASGVLVAIACAGLSAAQRSLSTPARTLRRRTVNVEGSQWLTDGSVLELSSETLRAPLERALRFMAWALVVLAVALVVARL